MNKRRIFGAVLAMFCVAAPASIAGAEHRAGNRAKAKVNIDLRRHPTGGKTPVDVAIGLYVTNLVAIDETRESFEVGGYLTEKWQDPRLMLPTDRTSDNTADRNSPRSFGVEELWTPPIEAANSISHKRDSYSLEVDRNGKVTYIERFDAVLSNDYHLRRFPFDTQVLRFEVQPFLSNASAIQFAPQALSSSGISPEEHVELAAWRMKDLRYSAEKLTTAAFIPPTWEALFQIVIERRLGFYWWKIFLPLLMMTMIPTVVFWIDANQFDWMLKVPVTMLLSMVAFQFANVRDLPKVGYVTFLDAVFVASFAFCFFCILEITTVFLMHKGGMEAQAAKIHSSGRWAYPAAYFIVLLFLAIGFLA